MPENENDKPQGGEGVQSQGGENGASQGDAKQPTIAELLAKIDALERDNAGYRRKQRESDSASKKAEEDRMTQQAEWQKLAETRGAELAKLKPVAEQFEAITAAFNASLDNRLKLIPEDVRKDLVEPARSGMSPVDFSNWLDRNLSRLQARQAPPLDGGAGGTAPSAAAKVTAEARTAAEIAQNYGYNIKPEQVAARAKQISDSRLKAPGAERDTDKDKE